MQLTLPFERNVTLVGSGPFEEIDLEMCLGLAPNLIAADGGANALFSLGYSSSAIIGDMDSVRADAIASHRGGFYNVDNQNTTDFEKCLTSISAPKLIGLGFLGGRLDHELANLSALVKFSNQKCVLIGLEDICFLSPLKFEIELPLGERVSLFPMGEVEGLSEGLLYPIKNLVFDPSLKIGTSNEVTDIVSLSFTKRKVLIIIPKKYLLNVLELL
ncbi:MAG: thiamine diphosphokinase [Proteobacteria bacterium]|jgi:thiamine pyrophosphokinase|nr:thiamine diphosphokinase [Pseudomonadota bacterium]